MSENRTINHRPPQVYDRRNGWGFRFGADRLRRL